MRAKKAISAVNWTKKNQIYLERLGFLDGRTGRQRKDAPSISRFINECVTILLESSGGAAPGMRVSLTSEELVNAWIKYQVGLQNKIIEDAYKQINELRGMMIKH